MTKVTIKHFEDFLKLQSGWEKFIDTLHSDLGNYSNIEQLSKGREPIDFILGSFTWEDTTEGIDYWNRLDKKWRLEVRALEH